MRMKLKEKKTFWLNSFPNPSLKLNYTGVFLTWSSQLPMTTHTTVKKKSEDEIEKKMKKRRGYEKKRWIKKKNLHHLNNSEALVSMPNLLVAN
jgi:hypothetical protein